MADERRIITKVYYDTSGVLQGAEAAKGALASVGGETKKTKETTDSLVRQYQRLVGELNPVTKAQIGYARAVELTTRMVKEGKITQEAANATLRQAEAHYRAQATQVGGLTSLYQRLGGTMLAAFAGYKLLQLGRQAVDEAVDAAKAQALLEASVRSTGGAAGFTAGELDNMASQLSRLNGIDDEAIAGAEALLTKYKRISGEAFPRAIQLAIDMASAQGEPIRTTAQLASETEKLGKMLGDPARATALLKREGKGLNEEQVRSIQGFLKVNDLASAQEVIFRELESQYGGTAQALRETIGGSIESTRVAWGNFLEEIGKGLLFDLTGIDNLSDALTDPDTLKGAHELGQSLGQIAGALMRIASYNDEFNAFSRALAEKQNQWSDFVRSTLGLDLLQHEGWAASPRLGPSSLNRPPGGSPRPSPPPPPPAAPPADPAAIAAAEREAQRRREQAEKLRDTYAQILAQHEETRRVQGELNALYSTAGLTRAQQLAGETKINAEHEGRVARLKAIKQFQELGLAEAGRMADVLAQINKEESQRAAHIEAQKEFLKSLPEQVEAAHKAAAQRAEVAWERSLAQLEPALARIRQIGAEIQSVNADLEFAQRSGNISAPTERLRAVEQEFLAVLRRIGEAGGELSAPIAAGEAAFEQWAKAFGETAESIKAKLGEVYDREQVAQYAADVRASFVTNRQAAQAEMELVRKAQRMGYMEAEEAERRLAQIRGEMFEETMSQWGTLFGFLGDTFGGFIQQVAQSLSNVQGAYQAGKSLDMSGFAAGSALGGAFGMIFAEVAIFMEIYKAVSADIKRERMRRFSTVTTQEVVGGQYSPPSYFDQAGREAANALEQMIRDVVDSLDAVLSDLPQIAIRARRDGKEFSAYVAGVWVGTYRDAQTALENAVAAAIQQADFSAISEEFAIALRGSIGATMDELQRNLDVARAARSARLGDAGSQYVEVEDAWRRDMDAARRLGLSIEDMIEARNREAAAVKNSVLGIDTSVADQIRAVRSLNAGMAEAARSQRAFLEQQAEELRRQIAAMERRAAAVAVGGGAPGVAPPPSQGGDIGGRYAFSAADEANEELAELKRALAKYLDELGKIPDALSDTEFSMGIFRALFKEIEGNSKLSAKYAAEAAKYALLEVEARFAAIKRELELAGKWEEFAQMFSDVYEAAKEEAGRPNRGGGRGGGRGQARQWLDDNAFRLATERMGDVERQLAEMNRMYDQQSKELRKGSKEMERLNQQRKEEAELIRQRAKDAAGEALEDYVGGQNPFEAERERFEAVKKQQLDLFTSGAIKWKEYKAAMDRAHEALKRHQDLIARQETATLFGQLAGLLGQAGLGETAEALQLIADQQRLNFELALEEARVRYEMLVAEGRLTDEQKERLDGILRRLEGLDPNELFRPGAGPAPALTGGLNDLMTAAERFWAEEAQRIQEATALRDRYAAEGEDPFVARLRTIGADFEQIFAALGRGPENLELFRDAVERAFDGLTAPVQDWLDSIDLSARSNLTGQQQLDLASRRFDEIAARIAAGDFAAYAELPGAGDRLLELAAAQHGTAGTYYQELLARVRAMGEQSLGLARGALEQFIATGRIDYGNLTALPLETSFVVEAISQARRVAEASDSKLAEIRHFSEYQTRVSSELRLEVAGLRAAMEAIAANGRISGNMQVSR